MSSERALIPRVGLALLFAAECAVCVRTFTDEVSYFNFLHAADNYVNMGRTLVSGGGITTFTYPPVLPVLPIVLCLLMWASPVWWLLGLATLHAILLLAICWMVLVIAKSMSPNLYCGPVVCVLFATDYYFLLEVVRVEDTILFSLLITAFFFLLVLRIPNPTTVFLLSLVASIAHLVRPTSFIFFIVLAVYCVVELQRSKKRIGLYLVGALVPILFLVIPWQMYVSTVVGEVVLTSTLTGGENLYEGNGPYTSDLFPTIDLDAQSPFLNENLRRDGIPYQLSGSAGLIDQRLAERRGDRYFRQRAFDYMLAHPTKTLTSTVVKALMLYSPFPIPLGSAELQKDGEDHIRVIDFVPRKLLPAAFGMLHGLIVITGAGGWFLTHLKQHRRNWYILLFFVLFTAIYAVTYPEIRHRVPVDPLLILLSSLFWVDTLSTRRVKGQCER